MRWLVLAMAAVLAGCSGPTSDARISLAEPDPHGDAGPFSGNGTIHAVAVYFSFELDADGAHGNMGAHCGFDDWTLTPSSVRMHVPSDEDVPKRVAMRQIHPDEEDIDQVSHSGTAADALWRDTAIDAAFDYRRELGTVTWHDDAAWFGDRRIPTAHWLLLDFRYSFDEGSVVETLYLRDLGEVPLLLDREDKMCA